MLLAMLRARRVVETALYVDDLDAAEAFYREVLGLALISRNGERDVFFRVGDGILLLFRAEETRKGGSLPPHGAEGAGHVALEIGRDEVDAWKQRLAEHDITIEKDWTDATGTSLYFYDPAGNLVELITAGRWEAWYGDERGTGERENWGTGSS